MMPASATFVVDFGDLGNARTGPKPFRLCLSSRPLDALCAQARDGHRIYELMLIERLGDVWPYVEVVPEVVPPGFAAALEAHGTRERTGEFQISVPDFDRFIDRGWVYSAVESLRWRGQRDSESLNAFAAMLLALVRETQAKLGHGDALVRHELARIASRTHGFDRLDRDTAVRAARCNGPRPRAYPLTYYQKLEALLQAPDLCSVAHRGLDDGTLRILARVQRERARATGHRPLHALYVSSLAPPLNVEALGCEIRFYAEGLGHGDLLIDEEAFGTPIRELIEIYRRATPGQAILAPVDRGNLEDYVREEGPGWILYRHKQPLSRRAALDRLAASPPFLLRPVVAFRDGADHVFAHERAIIVVGPNVPPDARSVLTELHARWARLGHAPELVVLGEAAPFFLAGCSPVTMPPDGVLTDEQQRAWLLATLRERGGRLDVVMIFGLAGAWYPAIHDLVREQAGLWPALVVTDSAGPIATPFFEITGALAATLHEGMKPERMAIRRL